MKSRAEMIALVSNVHLSVENAQQALLAVCDYLKAGEPLPLTVAAWLHGAIKTAINTPEKIAPTVKERNKAVCNALVVGLGLKSNNRRKRANKVDVVSLMKRLRGAGWGSNETKEVVCAHFEIDEKTYRSYMKSFD